MKSRIVLDESKNGHSFIEPVLSSSRVFLYVLRLAVSLSSRTFGYQISRIFRLDYIQKFLTNLFDLTSISSFPSIYSSCYLSAYLASAKNFSGPSQKIQS
jgi:hypothetical protein